MKNDWISRRAAIDIARFECGEWEGLAKTIIKRFEQLPSVQPERKRGRWLDGYKRQTCSLCKGKGVRSWNYCPYCGANMREVDDERPD